MKGFGYVKFDLYYGESIPLYDLIYVPELKKNVVSIFSLEYKGKRVDFIKGKIFTCPRESHMRDAFTLGS